MKAYNYNEYVKFRLGADGRKVLADYIAKEKVICSAREGLAEVIDRKYSPDENHMIKLQMWEMIEIFGASFRIGKEMFAGGMIYLDETKLTTVTKADLDSVY